MDSRMKVWWRGLFQQTVWSHVVQAKIPPRYQTLYTFILPFKFFIIGMYGMLSIGVKITSIDIILGDIYGDIWSWSLMLAGYGACLGICFYDRFIKLEALSIVFMLTLMAFYTVCIFVAAFTGSEEFRYLSLLLVIVFLPMPSWRIYDIIRELRPPVVS